MMFCVVISEAFVLLFNSSHSNSYDVFIGLFLSYALIEDILLSLLIVQ